MSEEPSLNPYDFISEYEIEKSIVRFAGASKELKKLKSDVVDCILQRDIKAGEIFTISIEEYCKIMEKKK